MMGRDNITAVMMAILMVLLAAGLAFAIPPVINYQGKLVDSVGDPVNDSVEITFTIYNATTGGDVLWTETQTVGVVNGIFNVYLGAVEQIPDSTFSTDAVYLGVKVGTNAEMTPRQLYSAAPYAFRAHSADMVAEGAVTSAMITNGTIIGTDIATDSITSNEIASGAVNTSEIAPSAVTTSEIADGTITDADIDANASISASKINRTSLDADTLDSMDSTDFFDRATFDLNADGMIDSANNADTLDGEEASVFSKKYEKIAVVAKRGGDYASPVDAANDYLAWCGTPSMTNPCLIKVMPGVYDIGTNSVVLQPLLNIEGSGINSTAIIGTVSSYSAGVINGAATSEIKHLTVQNKGGGLAALAIYNNNIGDSMRIYDVRATAEGATDCYTIFNDDNASAEIRTVAAFANCTGQNIAIYSDTGSEITIENTNIEVWEGSNDAYGIEFLNSSSFMFNVRIKASSTGNTTVSGVYYFSATGEMHNVKAEAWGGSPNGVLIKQNSDVTMRNVTVKASDPASGKDTSGININLSNVDMEGVSIEATSSSVTNDVRGLYADVSTSGKVRMRGINVTATGGSTCYGIDAVNAAGSYIPITDAQAWCQGASTTNYGISVEDGDYSIRNVEAIGIGEGGGSGLGIYIANAYASMEGIEALGNGGSSVNYGIYATDSDIEGANVKSQGESSNGTSNNYGLLVSSTGDSSTRITGGLIKSYGGNKGYGGAYISSGPAGSLELTGVTVLADNASDTYGIFVSNCLVEMSGATILVGSASNTYGIFLNPGSADLTGVKVQATNATSNYGIYGASGSGSITVDSSRIEADTYTVYASGSGYSTTIGSTRLKGVKPTTSGSSTFSCASSYHDMGGTLADAYSDCQ